MNATLVVGASGATGRQLVQQLLNIGQTVKVIVRNSAKIPENWDNNNHVLIIRDDISGMHVERMAKYIEDCHSVASCLGHNLTFKGIYGKPRKLVTNTVRLICDAIKQNSPGKPIKFVLMNTAGNRNRNLSETVSFGHKMIIGLVRLLLPPQTDNEKAADYLRVDIGQRNPFIEWAVVRPDTLVNEDMVTGYSSHESPTRSAVYNPGKTSRINVGHFMAQLVADNGLWNTWKGKMPVIYNKMDEKM